MTTKHTPGPWVESGEFILGADHTTICQARDEDAWEANAQLIAAAPELLAALEGLMEHFIGDRSSRNVVGAAGLACDVARAAIAKAKGGAS